MRQKHSGNRNGRLSAALLVRGAVFLVGLTLVLGTSDVVDLDDGLFTSGRRIDQVLAERTQLASRLQVAAAARNSMQHQRNQATTALSENDKLKAEQEQGLRDLKEEHQQELNQLHETFTGAMAECQPKLHRVQQAKVVAAEVQARLELIRVTIEKLDHRVGNLTEEIPLLRDLEQKAADAVPATVTPMETAQAAAHAARSALLEATNAGGNATLPTLQDAKKVADKAFLAALIVHQEAAQDAEWSTRKREQAEEDLEADTAASVESKTNHLPALEQAAAAATAELETARTPGMRRLLQEKQREYNIDAEISENNALRAETTAAGQLTHSYQAERDTAQRSLPQEQAAVPQMQAIYAEQVARENDRHDKQLTQLRPHLLEVMDLCQRHAWRVFLAKRAVAEAEQAQVVAEAKVESSTQNVDTEQEHLAQETVTLLANTQEQTQQAVSADEGVIEAEQAQQAAQGQVENSEQAVAGVQSRLSEAKAELSEASSIAAGGEAAIVILKEGVKKAAVGSCFTGDCTSEGTADATATADGANATNTSSS